MREQLARIRGAEPQADENNKPPENKSRYGNQRFHRRCGSKFVTEKLYREVDTQQPGAQSDDEREESDPDASGRPILDGIIGESPCDSQEEHRTHYIQHQDDHTCRSPHSVPPLRVLYTETGGRGSGES